jgi:hypothetical protein
MIHSTRPTPFFHSAARRLRQVIRPQVPSFPSFPVSIVTCLFTDPHALWGLLWVNSTPPIQELDFRQGLPLVDRFATSATRATKYYLHMQPFCTVFPAIHSILHLAYLHQPSEVQPLRITSGSFLPNAEWPSLTRLLHCFLIRPNFPATY